MNQDKKNKYKYKTGIFVLICLIILILFLVSYGYFYVSNNQSDLTVNSSFTGQIEVVNEVASQLGTDKIKYIYSKW